ncbi:GTP pyrophosphokinase family protein [Achromobacter sp. K91]|uniref:GTP pyrophosphokinase n=1 Tax=Achromobacter sp. K91 TaxID=2292262 RepID=UPI00131426D9|nr:GTP pyrophosphokinase [Achromobacter sp. K91]
MSLLSPDLLSKHARLTETIEPLVRALLHDAGIPFLAVTGRTKTLESAEQKIQDKKYSNPELQLMDLTGIRIILYVESDVTRAVELMRTAFRVDDENSVDKDKSLSVKEAGYRSVHLICDIGRARARLKEYASFGQLKFEIQVRTVLQHAWAELEHDKNYKFQGGLPEDMQRQLYLYAGSLELADRGLDRLAREIDEYVDRLRKKSEAGDLSSSIDAVSLHEFIDRWTQDNGIQLEEARPSNRAMPHLLKELEALGIRTLNDLSDAIPVDYVKKFKADSDHRETNIYGLVRDWLIIKDPYTLSRIVDWSISASDVAWLSQFMSEDDEIFVYRNFDVQPPYDPRDHE